MIERTHNVRRPNVSDRASSIPHKHPHYLLNNNTQQTSKAQSIPLNACHPNVSDRASSWPDSSKVNNQSRRLHIDINAHVCHSRICPQTLHIDINAHVCHSRICPQTLHIDINAHVCHSRICPQTLHIDINAHVCHSRICPQTYWIARKPDKQHRDMYQGPQTCQTVRLTNCIIIKKIMGPRTAPNRPGEGRVCDCRS